MLKDELQALKDQLIGRPAVCSCSLELPCSTIRNKWSDANFQDVSDDALRRYYSYHLRELARLADQLQVRLDDPVADHLLRLMDDLLTNYDAHLDSSGSAPAVYLQRLRAQFAAEADRFRQGMTCPAGQWLRRYFKDFSGKNCSFERAIYLAGIHRNFCAASFTDAGLCEFLVSYNFNHVGLARLLTEAYATADADLLVRERAKWMAMPCTTKGGFDREWMSLQEMLVAWLTEEIALRKGPAGVRPSPAKVSLNLSVAHLAFLTKLSYKEGVLGTTPLKDVFRQVCSGVRTKRQPAVSVGSFSKEFYGVDQQTAARVRDLLQRMINRINKDFFP